MQIYTKAILAMVNAETDFDDGMTFTLHTSSYALSRTADDYVNDLTNELATANGYTAGGIPAGVVTRTHTVANSWAITRAASTGYTVGDVVRPAVANGFLYRATNSGSSGASLPTYPTTLGQTVVDGGVTWECYGIAITVFTSTNPPTWASPFNATGIRYLVLSDRTPGTAATQPLIAVADFGTDQAGTGAAWGVTPHPSLGLFSIIHQ
jgi:hypothetical protein